MSTIIDFRGCGPVTARFYYPVFRGISVAIPDKSTPESHCSQNLRIRFPLAVGCGLAVKKEVRAYERTVVRPQTIVKSAKELAIW
jgi:hypothetical protein